MASRLLAWTTEWIVVTFSETENAVADLGRAVFLTIYKEQRQKTPTKPLSR